MTDLEKLQALAEKATPGPWEIDAWFGITNPHGDDVGCVDSRESADFIAAARTAIPSLIAEVKRLLDEVADRDWQPIETAPKDGTPVVLYAPSRHEPYQCGFWIWETDDNDDPNVGCWWLADGRYDDQPTHWQPMRAIATPQEKDHG